MSDIHPPLDQAYFKRRLHEALVDLYDSTVLTASPLIEWMELEGEGNKAQALRSALAQAIETLKPSDDNPTGAKSWRVYQILSQRYIGQWTQRKVADNIGLSERQLQREEKAAFEILADFLWSQARLDSSIARHDGEGRPLSLMHEEEQKDFQGLASDLQPQLVELAPILRGAVNTLTSVADSAGVEVKVVIRKGRSVVTTQAPLFRQGVLNLLNQAIQIAKGGQVTITMAQRPTVEEIEWILHLPDPQGYLRDQDLWQKFTPARKLIEACGGKLQIEQAKGSPDAAGHITVSVTFPEIGQVPVLFIDDHADTLRLYQYHLVSTHYQFLGAPTGRQGLALAKETQPRVIVIDVMMPDQDGWRLLEQLRMHPKTQNIPVIVCSILPQNDLALALGAASFLQKPVKQSGLLEALDRLTSPRLSEFG